jgi:predicted enzyme related to lactoylglutathione lyase
MRRVTGIGGIFFKAQDPEKLRGWYDQHLGITAADQESAVFAWRNANRENKVGHTVWALFPPETRYFDPGKSAFMINYRVENLEWLLEQLRREGVEVDERVEQYEYGKFGWVMDPEGNRIELWEPPKNWKMREGENPCA